MFYSCLTKTPGVWISAGFLRVQLNSKQVSRHQGPLQGKDKAFLPDKAEVLLSVQQAEQGSEEGRLVVGL